MKVLFESSPTSGYTFKQEFPDHKRISIPHQGETVRFEDRFFKVDMIIHNYAMATIHIFVTYAGGPHK